MEEQEERKRQGGKKSGREYVQRKLNRGLHFINL